MLERWSTIESRDISNFKIFDLKKVIRENKAINKKGEFVLLNAPNWVNIIPITKDNKIILVKQFRHGINDFTFEIPGGMVDFSESPQNAAERECLEETGYSSVEESILLGDNFPNPAFLNNFCYSYLWRNCELTSSQQLDGNEDIEIISVDIAKIPNMIMSGVIRHALVLNAFLFYFMQYGGWGK